jgi:hypothetical protein
VITSGNYRNGKTQQPELILEKNILPYIENWIKPVANIGYAPGGKSSSVDR